MTNLAELAVDVEWPDHDATIQAHDSLLGRPSLGELGTLAEWACGVQGQFPPREIRRPRLVVFVCDHAVGSGGASAAEPGTSEAAVAGIDSGSAAVSTLARLAGAGIRLVQLPPSARRIDIEDALSADEVTAAVATGAAAADEEIDAGADLFVVGSIGIGSTTVASALISVLTSAEPIKVTGRGGSGINDDQWMHKVSAVRDARRRGWVHRSEPEALLAAIGGPDVAALAGFLLRAAARRTPVLFDGVVVTAAAVVASAEQPRATRWWRAAQRTGEPAQPLALARLDLTPILDIGLAAGDGSGGLLALGLLQAAIATAAPGRTPPPPNAQAGRPDPVVVPPVKSTRARAPRSASKATKATKATTAEPASVDTTTVEAAPVDAATMDTPTSDATTVDATPVKAPRVRATRPRARPVVVAPDAVVAPDEPQVATDASTDS